MENPWRRAHHEGDPDATDRMIQWDEDHASPLLGIESRVNVIAFWVIVIAALQVIVLLAVLFR